MTHQNNYTFVDEIAEKGLDAIPELMQVLINNTTQVERSIYLQAEEYERTGSVVSHISRAHYYRYCSKIAFYQKAQ